MQLTVEHLKHRRPFARLVVGIDDDGGAYNQADAAGFIKLNALRLRIAANLKARRRR